MFDLNVFKKAIKEWMRNHPAGSMEDLTDFCEELIPQAYFTRYQWLVEQTVGWYQHVLAQRENQKLLIED